MPVVNALDFTSAAAAEGALKKVKQWMVRAGQPVVGTEFVDKPKRSNSITYREATLTLASGQLITLRVNGTGDIFQAVLNSSVVPIKNHDDMAKAVAELAGLAEKNQAAFQKAQARVKVALPPGMSTPKPKIADALQQRVTVLDTQIADRKATLADLQQQLGAMTDSTPLEPVASGAPEPTSWFGFKLVNQAYVNEVGPIEVPSRFQIGANVFLGVRQAGDKMDIAVKVIGASFRASKVHYTLAVPIESEGDQQMYAVLHDVDSISIATAEDLLDSTTAPLPVASLEAYKDEQPAEMTLAAAYVAARDLVTADPVMLDSAATAGAVAQLRVALDVVETNYPINVEAGNLEQAKLQLELAASFKLAIGMLDSAPAALSDAGLAQLVAIALVSAAEQEGIADQQALAELLALGMVETDSGLYMATAKGVNALDDAGYDPYGEPYAASQD